MTTTAKQVIEACAGATAYTLYGGYAVRYGAPTVHFEPCRVLQERRNREGRVVYLVGLYRDGSKLTYTWSKASGPKLAWGRHVDLDNTELQPCGMGASA